MISEVGKPPDFILEVASRSTGRNDYTTKRKGYAGYGVREYWRFDHTGGRYHDAALAGDVLVDGEYERLSAVESIDRTLTLPSRVLGLELRAKGEEMRFHDPATGRALLSHGEEHAARLTAEARIAELEARLGGRGR